ncbi:hypothetical protein [Paenibacillus typhae]|uniref:hypothetical protein n=1 Tax=Paenibacillus typhae TaxID=1174501 RepID=UPI001C8E1FDB|nr:hypothetical protein [Paenibacillus typhae]
MGEIRGKNPSGSAESGRTGELKGKNPFDSAESGRTGKGEAPNTSATPLPNSGC